MRIIVLLLLLTAAACEAESSAELISKYRETADRIILAATNSTRGWERLTYFCDHFPQRLSGSTNLERGIDWMLEELQKDGFENVHGEEVKVPHWVRGAESAIALEPIKYGLHMLGLGGSIGTVEEGITAEVLVVKNFEELRSRGDEAKGKIVLFNLPFTSYSEVVYIRSKGAIEAAKAGAVASLIRSITPYSMRTPHTGMMRYDEAVRKIPHAAIAPEDADWIARAQARKERVVINLKMSARNLPDKISRNVVAELRGSEEPEKYFLLSAHLDSWDVGQGAMDDAGGCTAIWDALRVPKTLKLRPRSTLRLVLYTNEENGLEGARQYYARHTNEVNNYIMAFETDEGVFQPRGFQFTGPEQSKEVLKSIVSLLEPIGGNSLGPDSESSDLIFLREAKVPALDLIVEGSKYFWFHHTEADTLDKLNPAELNRCTAAIAVVAYCYTDAFRAR
jgi:carboxypeptidase Q